MNTLPDQQSVRTLSFIVGFVLLVAQPFSSSLAQVTTTITPSGLNTQVGEPVALPNGQVNLDITGGTRPGNGPNLFHSFGEFSVGANNIANFLNNTGLPTSNILSRVTGGNPSNIFGTLQTTGFGNANLFLINPAGVIFGPTASLNVGGIVSVSTADYLRLADGARFNAIPNVNADALLSMAPVASFGFLGSNPGAITVQGSQLSVADGTGISLVGGNITIQSGTLDNGTVQSALLSVPSGQINLVSVGQPQYPNKGGEISVTDFSPSPTRGFNSMGTIALSDGTSVTASSAFDSGMNGGRVVIRGGKLTVVNSTVEANLGSGSFLPEGQVLEAGMIDVHAGAVTLDQAVFLASNKGAGLEGDAGQIRFTDLDTLSSINSTLQADGFFRIVRGSGGSIAVGSPITESIRLTDTTISAWSRFTRPEGHPGNITLTAREVSIDGGLLNVSSTDSVFLPAGQVTLNADRVAITNGAILRASDFSGLGGPGDITIQGFKSTDAIPTRATDVLLDSSSLSIGGTGSVTAHGGHITVRARNVIMNNASLGSQQTEGTINLAEVGTLAATNSFLGVFNRPQDPSVGSVLLGSPTTRLINLQDTTVQSVGGTINLEASRVNISGGRLFAPSFLGEVGHITAKAGNVTLTNGAEISSGVFGGGAAGDAGTVTIAVTGLFQSTGSTVSALGDGGAVSITAGNVLLTEGSTVTVNGEGGSNAGSILLNTRNNLKVIESAVTANSTGAGNAGTIQFKAGNDILLNKSTVSAQSEGTGNVGTIQLKAGDRIIWRDSVVTPAPTILSGENLE